MDIWQSAGYWYVNDGGREYQFDSEQEARQAMAKIETAKAIIGAVRSLTTAADDGPDVVAEYFDVGNWTDADVAPLGITAAQLAAGLTLLQQVNLLMTGEATTPAVYRTTLNQLRRVSA
jgi:hypothetical protein